MKTLGIDLTGLSDEAAKNVFRESISLKPLHVYYLYEGNNKAVITYKKRVKGCKRMKVVFITDKQGDIISPNQKGYFKTEMEKTMR